MTMRISIALCTFNGVRHLGEQLESIVRQSRLPDELVLRDDGSTDGTIELAQSILSRVGFPWRLLRSPGRRGSSSNFEHALLACEGDVVLPCDQDDVWEPWKLARIEEVMSSPNAPGFLFSNCSLIDERSQPLQGSMWERIGFTGARSRAFATGHQLEMVLRKEFVTGCTMAIRTELLRVATPFPTGWVHDHWLAALLTAGEHRGLALEERLVRYRVHPDQQIGLGSSAPARPGDARRYLVEAQKWVEIRERAALLGCPPRSLALLERKSSHLRLRARVRTMHPLARLGLVLPEMIRGGYRYDFHPLAWARDLLGA